LAAGKEDSEMPLLFLRTLIPNQWSVDYCQYDWLSVNDENFEFWGWSLHPWKWGWGHIAKFRSLEDR